MHWGKGEDGKPHEFDSFAFESKPWALYLIGIAAAAVVALLWWKGY